MKKIMGMMLTLVVMSVAFAQAAKLGDWQSFGSEPEQILNNVAGDVSKETGIQDTELNRVSREEGGYASQYTISNTLDSLRVRIAPYLQWIIYIGLSLAVIFIIYNGFLMVTGSVHSMGEWSAVQKRLLTLVLGVLLLTGFYFVIRLIVIVANSLVQ